MSTGPCIRIDTDHTGRCFAAMGIRTDHNGVIGAMLTDWSIQALIETVDAIWPDWWDGDQNWAKRGIGQD